MPRIDPERLLKCLHPLLEPSNGGIKSDNEVDKIFALMNKFSKKLVSKCTYINILKASSQSSLDLFMQRGGWDMVYSWLVEAVGTKNYSFLVEVVSLLLVTPATVQRLKENDLPRSVKAISRDCEHEETKVLAKQLVSKWIAVAKHEDIPQHPQIAHMNIPTSAQDSNMSSVSGSQSTVSSTMSTENSSLEMEENMPNEFDTNTFDLGSADLNELMKDLNPDDFTKTIDQFSQDQNVAQSNPNPVEVTFTDKNPPGEIVTSVQEIPKVIIKASGGEATVQNVTSTIKVDDAPYCLITRDGKHYLMKLQKAASDTSTKQKPNQENSPSSDAQVKVTAPENTKLIIRKESVENEAKNASESRKENKKTFKIVVRKDGLDKSKSEKEKLKKSSTNPSESKKSHSSSSSKRSDSKSSSSSSGKRSRSRSGKSAAQEAKEKEERHEAILREKIKQSKQQVKQRQKEAVAIKQQEKDQETLKALNLGPSPNKNSIPKIPKKQSSFADAIGIPGSVDKLAPVTDKSSSKSDKKEDKSPDKSVTSDSITPNIKEARNSPEKESPKQRRHRMKVFNSKTSRSDDLLRDMTETVNKNKSSSTDNKNDTSSSKATESKSVIDSKSSSSLKTGKRLSTEGSLDKPDVKKAKLATEDKVESDKLSKKEKLAADLAAKKAGIQESSLFMDALNAGVESPTKIVKRKRRTSSSGNEKDIVFPLTKLGRQPPAAKKEKEVEKPVFNFYRDTMSEKEDETPMDTSEPDIDDNNTSETEVFTEKGEERTVVVESPEKMTDEPVAIEDYAFVPGEDDGKLKSALCIHRSKGKPKKSVQWREEEELKEVYFFEMDETERVNVTKQQPHEVSFSVMKEKEKAQERVNLRRTLQGLKGDKMGETITWKPLIRIILPDDVSIPIVKSKEKLIQEEREKTILGLFLPPGSLVPDTPLEPDVIDSAVIEREPTMIPYEDIDNITNICDHTSKTWPASHDTSVNSLPHQQPDTSSFAFGMNSMIEPSPAMQVAGTMFPPTAMQTGGIDYGTSNIWTQNQGFNIPPTGLPMQNDLWMMGAGGAAAGFPSPFGIPPPQIPSSMSSPDAMMGFGGSAGGFNNHSNNGGLHNNSRDNFRGHGYRGGRGGSRDMGRDSRRGGGDRDYGHRGGRDDDRRDRSYRGRGGWDRGHHTRDGDRDRDRGQRDFYRPRGGGKREIPCRYFRRGFCQNGEKCEFLHEPSSGPPNGFHRGSRSRRSPDRDISSHDGPSRRSSSEDGPSRFSRPPSSPTEENWEDEDDTTRTSATDDSKGSSAKEISESDNFTRPPSSPVPEEECWDDDANSAPVKEIPVD